jgi:hypothetical protein
MALVWIGLGDSCMLVAGWTASAAVTIGVPGATEMRFSYTKVMELADKGLAG